MLIFMLNYDNIKLHENFICIDNNYVQHDFCNTYKI